ncbi:MAG: DUF2254 domain-containing protein [Sphingobacteriales bacterium]|nr:MAG: DUF2254 domain-containing protein [Sphingobacteriales bacterium]
MDAKTRNRERLQHWISNRLRLVTRSIAFYPALLSVGFLFLAVLFVAIDQSEAGKRLKEQVGWLRLQDATTARTTVSVVAAGILSLTVFTFSMVMVILNQAASQMSNRVLDKLIGNRYQQVVLGCYIGTIVYALFLLSTISDTQNGVSVPALGTYLLIALAIIDIFLFIYFLHYITQSVKYAVVIGRIREQSERLLRKNRIAEKQEWRHPDGSVPVPAQQSGIFDGFDEKGLLRLASRAGIIVTLAEVSDTYLLEGTPILWLPDIPQAYDPEFILELQSLLFQADNEADALNYYKGFRQLTEVAVKALSPGVNDPGTAVESLQALAELFAVRLRLDPGNLLRDEAGAPRVLIREHSSAALAERSFWAIWDYGQDDRTVRRELKRILGQLLRVKREPALERLLAAVEIRMKEAGQE